ncbi:MAG: threonine-phosphate decarboxylase CobD [Rhodocyclaceae bacterium]|nr:threonine-phosphate decarboxylase CobD [Rhodocyclaceae bacterium]
MLEHGGQLRAAARRWGNPLADWLDLSTGIAPWPYPVPPPPAEIWQRLPEVEDGLEVAARDYYGVQNLLVLPGSQAAILALPRLFAPGRVVLPTPIYNEHPAAWQACGHTLVSWREAADYAVLCNPNNPTGARFTRDALLERARGVRVLVVDEAFIDVAPDESLAALAGTIPAENIVVLRSLGKFFGLAGARVGCAIAAPKLLDQLAVVLGPWTIAHPARWAARHALADFAWQAAQRIRLVAASERLAHLLGCLGEPTGTALFQHVATPRAAELHEQLARRAILVRHFTAPSALRFGLPGSESEWQRLTDCLKEIA